MINKTSTPFSSVKERVDILETELREKVRVEVYFLGGVGVLNLVFGLVLWRKGMC